MLQAWAHGRLPARARELSDTDDLVQVSLLRALDHIEGFEPRREGAFLAYLRTILLNLVREELRRVGRRPGRTPVDDNLPDTSRSLLEEAVGRETIEIYEAALAQLPAEQQEAVILRVEFDFTHAEVAEALGKSSSDAARMYVARALVRLAEEIDGRLE